MANVLTGLIPVIYEALDTVARELVGFIPAVTRNTSGERAAVGEVITYPITLPSTPVNITPGVTSPDSGDQTINTASMTITKSQMVPIRWNGEDQKGFKNSGQYAATLRQQFEQAFRSLTNAVEADLFTAAYQGASRAYGTAGTTPLGVTGDVSDFAQTRRILDDNGAPQSDLHMVLGSAAVANLRGKQGLLLRLNESGSSALLRQGNISDLPIEGFDMHNSAAVKTITGGTGASYVTSGSTAAGVNTVALVTGTGTVNAGDVVTFAADANNKYVVNTGVTAPGSIILGTPGARVVIGTANALTVGASYTPNLAFHRSAIQLIARAPAMPMGPNGESMDLAEDIMQVTDPVSGLTFDVAIYRQYRQMQIQICLAWGVKAVKSDNIAILIG